MACEGGENRQSRFRENITREFGELRIVEICKSAHDVTVSPPNFSETSRYSMTDSPKFLFDDILRSGNLPKALRTLFGGPLGERGKEPKLCENKRDPYL